jgi:hypothetical protein
MAAVIRKLLNQQRVLIGGSTKVMLASFFPQLPFAKSIFFSKRMDDAQRHFGAAHNRL